MAVLGVNCKKPVIFIVKTAWLKGKFKIEAPWAPIDATIEDPEDILDVYRGVKPIVEAAYADGIRHVVVLACAAGRFRAANETVKTEGVVELASVELGFTLEHVTPQSLKTGLGCASKETWQDRATTLFNASGSIEHWSEGMNGAVAAAYKATKP